MNMHIDKENSVRNDIMDAIRNGEVHMRPRWHFILFSAFAVVGTILVFLTLIYVVSLAVFFTRESGAFFAPSFGARGWLALLRGLPWLLISLVLVFIVLLEVLVSRFRFVYRKPLVVSIGAIVTLIFLGGFAISETNFHRQMFFDARHGQLPPPMGMFYGDGLRPSRAGGMYHGTIYATTSGGFILTDIEGEGTSTIIVTPRTRLPYGADFSRGDFVVVIGDAIGTDTIQAFGAREIGE